MRPPHPNLSHPFFSSPRRSLSTVNGSFDADNSFCFLTYPITFSGNKKNDIGPSTPATSSISAAAEAAAARNSALPHGKVFTVRPITSWIDKLASQHGSPTGAHNPASNITSHASPPEPGKKYNKRELVLKTMQDSYTEIILPFKTDKALLEEYINVGGSLR